MRHFCLISEQLVFFSLLATVILGAVSWQVSLQFIISVPVMCDEMLASSVELLELKDEVPDFRRRFFFGT